MSDLPKSPSIEQSRRTLFRATIVAAVFLALHVLPLIWRPNPLWGVDFLFYLPTPVQALFILLSVLLFFPAFRRQVRAAAATLPFSLWGRSRRVRITPDAGADPCPGELLRALFRPPLPRRWLFTHWKTGCGYVSGSVPSAAHLRVYPRVAPCGPCFLGNSGEHVPRLQLCVRRTLCSAQLSVASALGRNKREMSIVLAVLLTTGYMQLFFGYVENYALYMPGVLLYLLLGLRTLENRMPLYAPALVLGILLALHQVFAVFGPSLLFLAYRGWRHRQEAALFLKTAATVAALLCVPVSTAALLGLCGIGFEGYLDRMGGRNFLPLFADPGLHSEYRIFSFAHVLDFVNQQLLVAPVACMACVLLRKRDLRHQTFLLIAAVFPLISTFIARPEIGVFRDWDIFSLPALPLTLWVATALMERVRAGEPLFHSAFILCGAAAFHTLFWVSLNAGTGPSEARFVHLANRLTGISAVNSWLTLGEFHRRQDNTTAALQAYRRSIEADPTNPNRWLRVGRVYREIGQPANAIRYFEKAVELRPDIAVSYMSLGAAYSDFGQFDRAIEFTKKAIAIQPDNATAHRNLGAMYRMIGQVIKAIEHLERAVALRPDQAATHGNLGETYREAGNNAKAIEHFEKFIALRPRDTGILVNLSVAYIDEGYHANAIETLKRAVEIQPDLVAAYVNLGVVCSRIGEYAAGIKYLKKSLEIQPNHPIAHMNLGLNYQAQGLHRQAIEHFEKTLQLEPDHPQAAQIRQWINGIGE